MRVSEFIETLKDFSQAVNCDGDKCRSCSLNKKFNDDMTICNVLYEIEQLLKEKEDGV